MHRDPFVFKGRRGSLHVILDEHADFAAIRDRLSQRLTEANNFFRGAELLVCAGQRELSDVERDELARVVNGYPDLKLVGFVDSDGQPLPASIGGKSVATQRNEVQLNQIQHNEPQEQEGQPNGTNTLFIQRTVRAGQSIRFNGNVTIVGDVNPGAEVVATGHIVVLGVFRGIAHAGAEGDEGAIVAAYRLLPMQLRIANLVSRAPDDEPLAYSQPEAAHIRDHAIIIEPYHLIR